MVSHLVLRLVLHNMSSGQVSSSVAERVEALALLGIPERAVGRGFNPR